MLKFFAYMGKMNLKEAKTACLDKQIFKVNDQDFAKKRCTNKWGKDNFRLFVFEDYNNNETFKEVLINE